MPSEVAQRIRASKSRMREIRKSGSVGGPVGQPAGSTRLLSVPEKTGKGIITKVSLEVGSMCMWQCCNIIAQIDSAS